MHDLSRVVDLRKRKCERARVAKQDAVRELEEARLTRETAEKEAEAFRLECKNLEQVLLARLLNRAVTVNDLLQVTETLEKAKERACWLADRIVVCKNAEEEREERLEAAERQARLTVRRFTRIETLDTHVQTASRLEAMRREEALVEDFCDMSYARKGAFNA